MNEIRQCEYDIHYQNALKYIDSGHYDKAIYELGLCHILSKNTYLAHLKTHLRMLQVGFLMKNFKEIRVQVFRVFMSLITAPALSGMELNGNPGNSDYGFFEKLPVPKELQKYFQ